jgi:hypothetical protein
MTYSEMWSFREAETAPEVTGFDVEATDGHIGKVDDASYDLGSSCLVVDTGFWIFGKKRMIPAGTIESIDLDKKQIFLRLTKDQVKDAPDYDEAKRDSEDHRRSMDEYYSRW